MSKTKSTFASGQPVVSPLGGNNNHRAGFPLSPRGQVVWTTVAILVATLVRLISATGDLAIDEVWSYWFVETAIRSPLHVLALRHDNNHHLNTLIMYCLGTNLPGICYRLPAVIASSLTVWLAGRIATRRGGFGASVTTCIVVGLSYLLVLYGSEARGYSYAVCFAYSSWLFLLRIRENKRVSDAIGFGVCASLGMFSHLTFLYCYAGFCVWSICNCLQKPRWLPFVAHFLPFLSISFLALLYSHGMSIGGGDESRISTAIISTLSLTIGGPFEGDGALIAAAFVTLLLSYGFIRLCQTDRAMAACLATIIVLGPAMVLTIAKPSLLYPRYFLIPVSFALLLIADSVSGWWHESYAGRLSLIVIAGFFLAGNGSWIAALWNHGRGDYSQAVKWLVTQNMGRRATISSNHDFRNGMLLWYYLSRRWPEEVQLIYVPQAEISPKGTDWLILQDFEGDPPFPPVVKDRFQHPYEFKRMYSHHSLSGWNWWIYRRENAKE